MNELLALILIFALGTFLAGIYFAPLLVASHRRHRQMMPIFVLNFLLGWTLIGWAVSLAWALTVEEVA